MRKCKGKEKEKEKEKEKSLRRLKGNFEKFPLRIPSNFLAGHCPAKGVPCIGLIYAGKGCAGYEDCRKAKAKATAKATATAS